MRAHRLRQQERNSRAITRLTLEYHRAWKKLFSKADLKRASTIAAEVKAAWRKASRAAGGDESRIAALKESARRSFRRQIARALPRYRTWKDLHKIYHKVRMQLAESALTGAMGPRLDVVWADILPAPPPGAVQFVPPFPLFDVQLIDTDKHVTADTSFVNQGAGNLVNNIVVNQDEDTPAIIGLYGLIRAETSTSLTSCGVNITVPRDGRLQVNANVRNYYNKAVLSLRDNFGFSDGRVDLQVNLFIDVIRGREVIHLPTAMLTSTLTSDGDDVSKTVTDIDNSMLFQLEGVTEESFGAGERLQVMIGSEVTVSSKLDDMESQVSATYYWQVRKLFVGIV